MRRLPVSDGDTGTELERLQLENETLSAVVGVVSSGPDLVHILNRVVDLLTKATASHACFIYLPVADRLVLRAASPIYSHLVGKVAFGLGEGLAGWVMNEGRPEFIREGAIDDPRTIYVPELEEERFQSMIAVPIAARSGSSIGAIVLHTVAPREFEESTMNVLSRAASLVSGAIENARLYEGAQERVAELTRLSGLGREIAAVSDRASLYRVAVGGIRNLIGADVCRLYEIEAGGDPRRVAAEPPVEEPAAAAMATEETDAIRRLLGGGKQDVRAAGEALGLTDCSSVVALPLLSGEEEIGLLVLAGGAAWSNSSRELIRAAAHQLGLALEKIHLIERLTGENAARDLFEALLAGEAEVAVSRAAAVGIDLDGPCVVAVATPRSDRSQADWNAAAVELEAAVKRVSRSAVAHLGSGFVRALLPVRGSGIEPARRAADALAPLAAQDDLSLGLGEARAGAGGARSSLAEAEDAATIGRHVLGRGYALLYRDTGAYRYLIDLLESGGPDDNLSQIADVLTRYDRDRRSQLLLTLDVYLEQGRSVTGAARRLWVHPNTLRQRLDRIEALTGVELAAEDLLALHLAVKLARVRAGLFADPDPPPEAGPPGGDGDPRSAPI